MVILLWMGITLAADIFLHLDASEIEMGQTTGLTIEFVNIDDATPPHFPKDGGLSVELQNPDPVQHFSYQNGVAHHTLEYRYVVLGVAEGEWNIGPVSVRHKGRSHVSNTVSMMVYKGSSLQREQGKIHSELSHDDPYIGEVVVHRLRFSLRNPGIRSGLKPSAYVGLSPIVGTSMEQKVSKIFDDGSPVEVIERWIPLQVDPVSRYEVGDIEAKAIFAIHDEEQLPWFPSNTKERRFLGEPLLGIIQPLPLGPADFSGLVGDFSFRVYPKKRVVSISEPIELVFEIKGDGNLMGYRFPAWNHPGFEVFDDQPVLKQNFSKGIFSSSWVMTRTLLPNSGGDYTLEPFSLLVFVPQKQDYVRLQSDPIRLRVQGEESAMVSPVEEKEIAPVQWVQELPTSRTLGIPPWWMTWVLCVFPLWFWWKRERPEENIPALPTSMPSTEQAQLQILEDCLERFVQYCTERQLKINIEALDIAKQKLYLARYGGAKVDDVVETVRRAMVL